MQFSGEVILPNGLWGGSYPQNISGWGKAGPMLLPTALGLGLGIRQTGQGGPLTASLLYSPQGLYIFHRPLTPFPRACVVTVSPLSQTCT